MYRVVKALNHNAVLALESSANKEYLILGKGIGFGKKVSQRIEPSEDCTVYSLTAVSKRGRAAELLKEIQPVYLEMADAILNDAQREFGELDREVLFPMADHIAFAVKRIEKGEIITNLLTQDIQVLFYKEYKAASLIRPLLWKEKQIEIPDDEIGYVALHVHSAICGEKVSSAMQIAAAVRECVSMIEKDMGKEIPIQTLSYNRLMNHIKYMVARILKGETLYLNMNDYMEAEYPRSYAISRNVCSHLGRSIGMELDEMEIGYLAMHIERVCFGNLRGQ